MARSLGVRWPAHCAWRDARRGRRGSRVDQRVSPCALPLPRRLSAGARSGPRFPIRGVGGRERRGCQVGSDDRTWDRRGAGACRVAMGTRSVGPATDPTGPTSSSPASLPPCTAYRVAGSSPPGRQVRGDRRRADGPAPRGSSAKPREGVAGPRTGRARGVGLRLARETIPRADDVAEPHQRPAG